MQEFKDKVIVISGALGDIGLAIAMAYLKQQAKVVLGDLLSAAEAREKLLLLKDQKDNFEYKPFDVANARAVENWINDVAVKYGQIDICISNAARVTIKNYQNLSPDEWDAEMRVNVDGAFYFANFAAKNMVARGVQGNIIFLGSWAAHAVHQNLPAYSVSKAAVRMLNQTMALEYALNGIRVNEVAPGYVNAGLSKVVWSDNPVKKDIAEAKVPIGEIMETDDVAAQVLWLSSSQCRHVTGSTFLMDGGLSLLRP